MRLEAFFLKYLFGFITVFKYLVIKKILNFWLRHKDFLPEKSSTKYSCAMVRSTDLLGFYIGIIF